ncbi:unnamed protein product [Cochlearia groenlandica]
MSVNESVDPPYLFNVEDESPRFRVASKSKELEIVGDRRFEISEIPQGFFNKEETMDSDGDDDDEEEDSFVGRRGSLIQPGIDSTNNNRSFLSYSGSVSVRDNEEEKPCVDGHEMDYNVRITSSHHNTQAKRDFASVGKERVTNVSSRESLKAILSDPVTGALMSDATILSCGHSFGAGGLKEVMRMKACFTCSRPTSEGSDKPNLSLRVVIHAFRQEEESDHTHSLKRRKESSDQHKRTFCIPNIAESHKSSSRGIQFPFSIGDGVIIEGNKRKPPRFVGRKAVIMTHCLNGWYVVKTVDNGESIKLQHCSLAKIINNSLSSITVAETAPSWLPSS